MAFIANEIVSQVIDRCDIVEIISSYFPLKRTGKNFKANCPFHNEKTPSFIVNPEKQIYHCFGCGEGGNVVSFLMKMERMEFVEAVHLLAQKVNVVIPEENSFTPHVRNERQLIFDINELASEYFHSTLLSSKDEGVTRARDYLKDRGVSLDIVKQFRLGFAPDKWDNLLSYLKTKNISLGLMEKAGLVIPWKNSQGFYDRFRNRIIFSIFDARSRCVAFGARVFESNLEGNKAEAAKYINSPETGVYVKGRHLYGLHLARQAVTREDSVVIVEGYMDCLMPYQSGVDNVVASLGTALTVEQIRLLGRYTKNVVMLFDMDMAGQSAMMRSFDLLVEEGMNVKIARLEDGYDPDSFICKYGVDIFRERIANARTVFDYKFGVLMAGYDSGTVEGKAKISGEMLPTINKFGNAVIRAGYIKRLAQLLFVPEQALITELKKTASNHGKYSVKNYNGKNIVTEQRRAVEKNILKLLFEEEKFIPVTKEEVSLSDFQDVKMRSIISRVYELFEQGKEVNVKNLINSFNDQEICRIISELAVDDEKIPCDKNRMHRDCINRIKNDRLKLMRHTLLQEIRDAENSGEQVKLDELKERFNQLVRSN